jgi:hypothetical protein
VHGMWAHAGDGIWHATPLASHAGPCRERVLSGYFMCIMRRVVHMLKEGVLANWDTGIGLMHASKHEEMMFARNPGKRTAG